MPGTDTITIYRGEAVRFDFIMSPVENITGWQLKFSIIGTAVSVAATIDSGVAGTFHATLTAAQTDLRPGNYRYNAWRTDVASETVVAIGTLTVLSARMPTA